MAFPQTFVQMPPFKPYSYMQCIVTIAHKLLFRGKKEWTELDKKGKLDIPDVYVKGWYIEAIDASQSK